MSILKKINKTQFSCRDCKNSYDYQGINWNGDAFMCRCKFTKFLKFLNDNQCDYFELR